MGCSQAMTRPLTCGSTEPTTAAPTTAMARPHSTQLVRSVAM